MANLPPDAEQYRQDLVRVLQARWQSYMDSYDRLNQENPGATRAERMKLLERASEIDDIMQTHLRAQPSAGPQA